ncbi:DUF885 domain-containing protein [Pseudolysinimonas sp.]|uniref:DUF885 domain-containing protein n=1 Tax=Pseudolysinimonas sp. TaxID=2680009 RepID=UPI003F7F0140
MSAEEVADRLLEDLAPLDPTAAETLGRTPERVMPLVAPEHFAARHEAASRALAALGDDDSVLATVLRERLSSDLALDDAGFTTALLAPLATPVHAIRGVFDEVAPEQRADELARVPEALRDYAETLRTAPRVVAARQVLGAAEQCETWVDPARDDFYTRLVADQPELRGLADAASEATREFAAFLRTELLPRAPRRDAVGAELYEVTASAFLGERIDLRETYEFGWSELDGLTSEMVEVARELGYDTIGEAVAALDADPARALGNDQLTGWLQRRIDETVEAIDGVHVDLPPQARRPQAATPPTTAGVMSYSPPDPRFTRPGRVWWPPAADGRTSTWHAVTTVHHEGVPGHHLQIAVALAEPGLHPYQRSMVHVHGYAEGWAHYSERLADEFGLLRDPGERLGMLFGQRWRAARIVIDMGLHLGFPMRDGSPWTVEDGVELLQRMAGCDAATARFEVDRFLGWPAQALAFRVGARLWRQLRTAAAARDGFDAREFHMRALRLGPMGLGPLREVLGRGL